MRLRNILIAVFIISVFGLLYVQYQYLRIGLNLAAVQFDEKMAAVVAETEEGLKYESRLSFLVGKAVTKDDTYFNLSLDSVQDASRYFLDDYLKEVLVRNGINSSYTYVLRNRDTAVYLQAPNYGKGYDRGLSYPIPLQGYLPELAGENLVLELQFENLNTYFLAQLRGLTLPGLVFLLCIIGITLWVLKGFLKQRSLLTVTNEFINNLTHELKTPVFSIGLAAKLLAEKEGVDRKEVAGIIRMQLDKLNGQIDRVLELASLEEKGLVVEREALDLREPLKEVAKAFGNAAKLDKGVHFQVEIPDYPIIIKGMKAYLMNATDTLLDNAKKYSGDPKEITLRLEQKGKYARIIVRDNGIGISPEDQKRIFDKFYRVSAGDLHDVKGYGLGLHFVKRIALLHKGKVLLNSVPGMGSEFILQLPLK